MDIEGSEYDWIHSLSEKQLNKFNQIIIEFHSDDNLESSRKNRWGLWGKFDNYKSSALIKLAHTHYLVHLHGNNYSDITEENNIKYSQSI